MVRKGPEEPSLWSPRVDGRKELLREFFDTTPKM